MSPRPRRSFDPEYKLQIIQMIRDDGLSVTRVCREQGLVDSADYIVGFYNSERLHSTLGHCSPNDFERQTLKAA